MVAEQEDMRRANAILVSEKSRLISGFRNRLRHASLNNIYLKIKLRDFDDVQKRLRGKEAEVERLKQLLQTRNNLGNNKHV